VHGQDSTNRCIDLLQVLGALWYIFAIQREDTCWREACNNQDGCDLATLYCGSTAFVNNTFLQDACSINGGADVDPIFGIYLPVLQNVSQSTGFFEKLFYCFWWGLQNLWYTPNPHTHYHQRLMPWDLYLCVAICIAVPMVKTLKQALTYGRICLLFLSQCQV